MKHHVLVSILLFAASITSAADVKLAWDASANAATYQVYEKNGGAWVKVGTPGAETTATLKDVVPGVHTYTVSALNAQWESERSAEASTLPAPLPPTKLTIQVVVTVTLP